MIQAMSRVLLVFALLAISACAPGPDQTAPMTRSAAPLPAGAAPANPAALPLGSGDKVRVSVAGADKLNGDYEIDLSGGLALPLVGVVAAAGKTPPQLAAAIAQRLKDEKLMEAPQVAVALVAGRPFYALGEVKNPGKYPYAPGLNIISAIATAGGFTGRAERAFVFVRHPGAPNEIKVPLASALPVGPGDIIRVGERIF